MRDLLSIFAVLIPPLVVRFWREVTTRLYELWWDSRYGNGFFRLGNGRRMCVMAYAPGVGRWFLRRTRASSLMVGEIYTEDLITVGLAEEHVRWCWGWEGAQVDALEAAQALA